LYKFSKINSIKVEKENSYSDSKLVFRIPMPIEKAKLARGKLKLRAEFTVTGNPHHVASSSSIESPTIDRPIKRRRSYEYIYGKVKSLTIYNKDTREVYAHY